jgi:hypothetical protein
MNKNDHLFQLIKSLDKNEKRYFKLNSSHYGNEKQCIELFNCIDKQKEYDEEKLKKFIKNKQLLKRLNYNKHYLYNMLLKSLRPYSSGSTKEVLLKELLYDIHFLTQKRLYNRSLKLIEKGKKIGYKYEKYLILLELFRWERNIIFAKKPGNVDAYIIRSFKEEKEVHKKMMNESKMEELSKTIFAILNKEGDLRKGLKLQAVNKLLSHPLLKNSNLALSFLGKFHYYIIHSNCFRIKGNFKKSFEYNKTLIAFMESCPWQIEENSAPYTTTLSNFLGITKIMYKHAEFMETLNKMKRMPAHTINYKARMFERVYINETDYYMLMGEFGKAIALSKEITEGIRLYKGKITAVAELGLNYIMGYASFGNKNFREAIKWLNKVLHNGNPDLRQDVQSAARILNLISHFEIGNEDMLEYLTKSTINFLNKIDGLFKLESIVLEYLKNIALQKHNKNDLFRELHHEVLLILKKPTEKQVLENFDIISWIESKIEKRNFAEIVREKSLKHINR